MLTNSPLAKLLPLVSERNEGSQMIMLTRRIAEAARSIDPFVIIVIFSGIGLLISLLFGFDLALSALFNCCSK